MVISFFKPEVIILLGQLVTCFAVHSNLPNLDSMGPAAVWILEMSGR